MSIIERDVQAVPEVLTEREQRARTLEAAALEIEVRGWTRKQFCDDGGAVCAIGALLFVMGRPPRIGETFFDWDGTIAAGKTWGFDGRLSRDPMHWNDHRAKDGTEVAFLMRWRAEEIRDGR